MLAKDVIKKLGGSIAAAAAFGVTRATTCGWARRGKIPSKWAGKIRDMGIEISAPCETRAEAQKSVIGWLEKSSPGVFFVKFGVPSGVRSKNASANFPIVFFPCIGAIGMFVVVLSDEGRVRGRTAEVVSGLKTRGYRVEVARGSVEAISIIKAAFEGVSHV